LTGAASPAEAHPTLRSELEVKANQDGRGEAAQLSPSIGSVPELIAREISLTETRPLRHAVLRPHEPVKSLASNEPFDAYAVGVFDGEALIAVGFVAPDGEPGAWRVRGMATAAAARGSGAGTAVLDALLRHAIDSGASRVWCNARTPARSLYERAGFRAVSEEFELPDIGPHFVMERKTASAPR
jgi:ribosomal protein S18 acetylase RimI-like enzyme